MRRSSPSRLELLTSVAAGTAAALLVARRLTATPPPDGAVVLVTGGSRGLGYALASRFARRPVNLVLAARSFPELAEAQRRLLSEHPHLHPENFYLVSADLSRPEECRRMVSEAFARFGRIDVLINNAGIIEVGPIEALTADLFESTMRINFLAAMQTTWAALPRLLSQTPMGNSGRRRAAIVNIASIGGKFAVPHLLPYSAAKFAMVGFSEGLNAEVRGKGVQVTTVCPGLMRTGGEDHAQFLGNAVAEQRWFDFCAKTPGIATTPQHAADRVYNAVAQRRAEITITPQAWVGARFAGLFPETLQLLNGLTNDYVLPKA